MTPDEVLLEKFHRLANDPGAYPGEKAAARRKARKLACKVQKERESRPTMAARPTQPANHSTTPPQHSSSQPKYVIPPMMGIFIMVLGALLIPMGFMLVYMGALSLCILTLAVGVSTMMMGLDIQKGRKIRIGTLIRKYYIY